MASRSINKVTLLGNLTRDPELKYTPTGAPVCSFGLATNRSWTTTEGQTKEETQYHRVIAWHKLAELCSKLLTKGRKVYLEGRIAYRSYTGKDGQQKSITEIIMDDFIVFGDGRRPSGAEEELHNESAPEPVAEHAHEDSDVPTEEKPKKNKKSTDELSKEEIINPDDIPF